MLIYQQIVGLLRSSYLLGIESEVKEVCGSMIGWCRQYGFSFLGSNVKP